jgi:phthalate 3,4-dioxygenase ferredoxin reductase subunit
VNRGTVIVGASVGGVRTAQALRSAGYQEPITLVGDEGVLPYDKPPLSKAVLAGTATPEAITLLTEQQARDLDVRLVLGRAGRHLDLGAGLVELDDGERLPYDDVVIATGSRARPSPWGRPEGVHYVRTLADAAGLREGLRRGGPLVVVGAGFVGAEVAATARKLGVAEVTLIDPAPVPMGRVIDPATAARLGAVHRDNGVVTRFGSQVEAIEQIGDGLVVLLSDGSAVPAANVVVGIGALPNDEWLASSGLVVGGGLHCDERGRAREAPRVHAVGDVARWHHPGLGTARRAEHWTNAVEQAAYVAADVVDPGRQGPYQPIEYVWSDQYDTTIQIVGHTGGGLRQVTVERAGASGQTTGPQQFAVLYATARGALAGAVSVGWPQASIAARRAVAAGAPLGAAQEAINQLLLRTSQPGSVNSMIKN